MWYFVFVKSKVIGVRVGVTPRCGPEQLRDVTYYMEASAADGKNVSVCELLMQTLTGNSSKETQDAITTGRVPEEQSEAAGTKSEKTVEAIVNNKSEGD
jgi:hypothetical protein